MFILRKILTFILKPIHRLEESDNTGPYDIENSNLYTISQLLTAEPLLNSFVKGEEPSHNYNRPWHNNEPVNRAGTVSHKFPNINNHDSLENPHPHSTRRNLEQSVGPSKIAPGKHKFLLNEHKKCWFMTSYRSH